MATYSKLVFSGSTNGKQIKVAATSDPGTVIHSVPTGTSSTDEIWIWATNNHTSSLNLTIEWGSNGSPDDLIQMSIPNKTGLYLIIPGLCLQNSQVVKAYGSSANLICISGFVNRIT